VSASAEREIPVTFASFVVSLASSAFVHLGETPDPSTGEPTVNLALARNTIDLIGLLDEKTKGNLDDDEAKLVESVLYELRTKFVEKTKA